MEKSFVKVRITNVLIIGKKKMLWLISDETARSLFINTSHFYALFFFIISPHFDKGRIFCRFNFHVNCIHVEKRYDCWIFSSVASFISNIILNMQVPEIFQMK